MKIKICVSTSVVLYYFILKQYFFILKQYDLILKQYYVIYQNRYEDKRLTYLMDCLTFNPEFIDQQSKENESWFQENNDFLIQCLNETRSYVPATIGLMTHADLLAKGMSQSLARRIATRKCLWLVRMLPEDISKLHFADLNGQYSTAARNLDIVEMCAVLKSLPETFGADENGKKERVKHNLLREVTCVYYYDMIFIQCTRC